MLVERQQGRGGARGAVDAPFRVPFGAALDEHIGQSPQKMSGEGRTLASNEILGIHACHRLLHLLPAGMRCQAEACQHLRKYLRIS